VRRARISSQCIKRAIRQSPVFAETTKVSLGVRSRWFMNHLKERLMQEGRLEEKEVEAVLSDFIKAYLSKLDGSGPRTAVLLYLSEEELSSMSNALLERWAELVDVDEKTREKVIKDIVKQLEKAFRGRTSAPDIAMFGRMLAEKPILGLDAACQVAHAISTHRVTMEMDFYTAVDDLNPEDTAGAGMMGFTGFDSACYYRYSQVDWDQLTKNLNGDKDLARRTVEGFLRASVEAIPTGKQNSFAAQNPPSFLFAVVRDNSAGWSLANAFERPVRPDRQGGLVAPSVSALDSYWGRLCQIYGREGIVAEAALALEDELPLKSLAPAKVDNLSAWMGKVLQALPREEEA